MVGTVRDITERQQAEEALRKERDKAQQYLDIASAVLLVLDASANVALMNKRGCEILGYEEEEMVGKNWFDHFVPGRVEQNVKKVFSRIMLGQVEANEYVENHVLCRNGEERLVAWHNTTIRDETGKIVGTLSSGQDVTERRQAEAALRDSEERFRSLSAAAPIGIMLIDNKDGVFYCNKRFLSIFRLPQEKAMGFGWVKSLHPDDREAFLAERSKAMAEGRDFSREFRLVTPQGETRWLRVHATPLLSQEGVSNTRVGTVEDITERRQAEETDRQLNAEHVRANELRRMVRILEQMAATLGHELRNPLGVISNSAYFLANQAGIEDPRAERHVEIIGREVASATRVVDDILAFAHTPQFFPSPASLNMFVERALVRSQVPANVRVLCRLARDLPPVVCDEERLERAFIDIITNAVQAMSRGGRLSVKTGRSSDRATIVFHDDGDGIAPENLPKVFDPMFTTKLRGIGLGLTVVRRTVEEHGGKIDIRSKPGLGTTVTIELPFDCRSGPLVGHRRTPAATKVTAAPPSDDSSG